MLFRSSSGNGTPSGPASSRPQANGISGRPNATRKKQRAFFLRQLYQWHWISSGLCLIGMVLFAVTGITLNHAGHMEASPAVVTREAR